MTPLQNAVDPPLQGGNQVPSSLNPPLQGGNQAPSSLNPPPAGGHGDPDPSKAGFKTFPKCGHVISGDLYRDFFTKHDSDCPVCQKGEFQAVMKFGSCEHRIVGDPLHGVFKSSTDQCPVCIPLSNKSVATDAHSDPTIPTPTTVHTERSRVTLHKYQDPYTFEGVTGEMYTSKDGNPRLRVDQEVWKTWSRKDKAHFVYCTNIRLGQPVGESQQAPTNPGNPNHPDYRPTPTAGILRRNRRMAPPASGPDRVAAAIRQLLATPDKDVLPRES